MERLGKDDPQLVAELAAFSTADALQWAETSALTGRLTFRSDGARITLNLEKGGIVLASSNRDIEGLGRHLFAEGIVDEVDLAAAVVYSRDARSRIGAAMVELEVLDESQIRDALFDHNVNLTTLPASWTDGWVTAELFSVEEPYGLDPEPASARMILMEAARRADETETIRRLIPTDDVVLARGEAELPEKAEARWRRVLETHEPGFSVRSHYARVGGCHFNFIDAMRELVNLGVLRLENAA